MTVSRENGHIVIKLSSEVNLEEIQRFLNYLRSKEISPKSNAKQEDADLLAREVNKNWWDKNRQRFPTED